MNCATRLSPMTSPEADIVSGAAWVVVVEEGAGTVVGADAGVAAQGRALDGRDEVETTGRMLSLEVRGCDSVAQAATASAPIRRQRRPEAGSAITGMAHKYWKARTHVYGQSY
jgi:hypothetical protein